MFHFWYPTPVQVRTKTQPYRGTGPKHKHIVKHTVPWCGSQSARRHPPRGEVSELCTAATSAGAVRKFSLPFFHQLSLAMQMAPVPHKRASALGPGHMARPPQYRYRCTPEYRYTPEFKTIRPRPPPKPDQWSTVGSFVRSTPVRLTTGSAILHSRRSIPRLRLEPPICNDLRSELRAQASASLRGTGEIQGT
jgi:hypothetical protein